METVTPVVVVVVPGRGMEPDLVVYCATKKNSTNFYFRLAGHKSWFGQLIEAFQNGDPVNVDLVKNDCLSHDGKKFYLAKKIAPAKSLNPA
jgi:hypothetical protein